MENKNIANLIASRRKALGLTQQALADKLHITNKAVSKWETGEGLPDISLLVDLADALQISVDELLQGTSGEELSDKPQPDQEDRKKKERIFRLIARAFLLLNFFLPFVNVPLSQVLPDWIGLDSVFNSVFGTSLQASVMGFQMMLTLTPTGILLSLTFILHLTLWIFDLTNQLDSPFFERFAVPTYMTLMGIAVFILALYFFSSLSIQIGMILFVVFTLSLCLHGIKSVRT